MHNISLFLFWGRTSSQDMGFWLKEGGLKRGWNGGFGRLIKAFEVVQGTEWEEGD